MELVRIFGAIFSWYEYLVLYPVDENSWILQEEDALAGWKQLGHLRCTSCSPHAGSTRWIGLFVVQTFQSDEAGSVPSGGPCPCRPEATKVTEVVSAAPNVQDRVQDGLSLVGVG